ncbi:mitochondrial 54S ribosomal protein mL61 [Dipodascopsis tothii]|uniref:mitochondrial 54S ribosomal protein mL61 n=1 Tax=Dipodascopsis tothii TaxID=44089 RepID=UPI0034CF4588
MSASRYAAQARRLAQIATGDAAVRLPQAVQGLKLEFKVENSGGHMGARKFWKQHLSQIQFHNPELPIVVKRYAISGKSEEASACPAQLTISYESSEKFIDAKWKHSSDILKELIFETKAEPVDMQEYPKGTPDLKYKLN